MVKSGLEEPVMENDKRSSDPRVSPYRLAVHLISAFAIYAFLLSTAFRVIQPISLVPMSAIDRIRSASPSLRRMGLFTTALIFLTAFSGAFVAGNDAGLVYDEFPLMGGKLIPSDIIDEFLAPKWRNMFEHPVMVQWQHRVLALTTLFSIYALTFMCYSRWNLLTSSAQKASLLLFGMGNMQVGLGIATLLYHVPIPLAATHQAGSLALLSSAVFFITSLTPARPLLQSSAALPFLVSAVATRSSSQTTQSSSQTTQSSSQQTKSSS